MAENQPRASKWCEECGAKNDIVAQFCNSCGTQFPDINVPEFQQKKFEMGVDEPITPNQDTSGQNEPIYDAQPVEELKPPSYIPEGQAPFKTGSQQPPPNQYQQPPPYEPQVGPSQGYQQRPQGYQQPPPYQQGGYPPNYGQPQYGNQGPVVYELRSFQGNGLIDAAKSIVTRPGTATPELLEDQSAPNSTVFVLIFALLNGLLSYIITKKTDFIEVDVSSEFQRQYGTPEGIQELAIINAVTAFLLIFIIWFVGSFLSGLIIRGGLPMNSYVRYNPGSSMRKLAGYRYLPYIAVLIIQIILINFEDNRQSKVTMDNTVSGQPLPVVVNDFSSLYVNISLILIIASGIFSAYIFRKGLKDGLFHRGLSPTILAILIVVANFNRDLTM